MTQFIDIVDAVPSDPEYTRGSSLQVTANGLIVLGNLPHGYTFKPRDARNRDALIAYLAGLTFDGNTEG